jgi:NADH-quinone oxidoreductase subunit L
MWIGTLALSGIGVPMIFGHGIGFAGFHSKDAILEAAYGAHSQVGVIAYWLGIAGAFMTAFYSARLMFMTFYGKYRGDHHTWDHAHESPPVMLIPLYVLAAGAVAAGFVAYPWFVGSSWEQFWGQAIAVHATEHILHAMHEVPEWAGLLPLVMGIAGIGLSYLFYVVRPDLPGKTAAAFRPLYTFFYNKWYFDELYEAIFVQPALSIGRALWKKGDGAVIDGLGPDGITARARDMAGVLSRFQSGYLYHYAFAMLVGVVAAVTYFSWPR